MELYPYQHECLKAIESARLSGATKALVVMATGLGKTIISAVELKSLMAKQRGRVLYLAHKNEILRQARAMYEAILDTDVSYGYFHGEEKHLHKVDVLFASFQTMANWREEFLEDEFRYIVIDEAHHVPAETYQPTVEYFEADFTLGLTATPDRSDQQDITKLLGKPVFYLGLFEALAEGYLSKVDYRLMTDEIELLELNDLPVGKLSIAGLNRTIFIPKRDEEIIRIIDDRTADIVNPRMIIFCASIAHAKQIEELMPHALLIHSLLPSKVRQQRVEEFRRSRSATVITIDIFNEGIDIPEANVIVFLRSTVSRTIYLQQLGRGLRRYHGKDKVLVLDFVANCERIEMIDFLRTGVEDAKKREVRGSRVRESFVLTIDGAEFDEQLVDLAQLVKSVRGGYTREDLVGQIKFLADELGRTPSITDLKERKDLADPKTFYLYFKSWNNALRAAGMKPGRELRYYSNEELIEQLRTLGRTLGRIPTGRDLDPKTMAHRDTYKLRFGSWYSALREAGFETAKKSYSRDELIEQLRFMQKELGRTPELRDVTKYVNCASPSTFSNMFGSWNKALEAAGIDPRVKDYTREEMIAQLQDMYQKLGRKPTTRELGLKYNTASPARFVREFGSLNNALAIAGFSANKIGRYSTEELIDQLRQLSTELGRAPKVEDLMQARNNLASASTFKNRFGSLGKALEAAGY